MDNVRTATCIYCNKKVKARQDKNNTSSVKNHFLKCKMNPANIKYDQTCINFPKVGTVADVNASNNWHFDAKKLWATIVDKFIIDETSFLEIDKPGFRKMCKVGFHPSFNLPGRHTLANDVMKRHESLRESLRKFFSTKSQRVSLTSDCWTSNQKVNYMSLTAHFIDDSFRLQKKILSFVQVDSHKGDDLAFVVENSLGQWSIDRVLCITLDNASANDVMARNLKETIRGWGHSLLDGEHLHMRCAAHIVNLVVTQGMKEHQQSVSKLRFAVGWVKKSPGRWKKIKEAAVLEKIVTKKHLWLDSPTRWNGAFIMLDRACQYRRAFERYAKMDKSFKVDMADYGGIPTKEDWESLERLVKFLEHFHKLTKKVSGSWYCTSNVALPEISDLYTKMKKLGADVDPCIRAMATRMITKFDKYWGLPEKMNINICFALVLDPRCKIEFLSFTLCNLYGPVRGKLHVEIVKSEMAKLYNEYESSSSSSHGRDPVVSSSANEPEYDIDSEFLTVEEFNRQRLNKAGNNQGKKKTELDKYLGEDADPYSHTFDVLQWWKVNSARLPNLSAIEKDILVVSVSTVASESAFSTGRRVLSDF